jgi:two-component system, LytTR family, response regulator
MLDPFGGCHSSFMGREESAREHLLDLHNRSSENSSVPRARVLIVDDEPIARRVLREELETLGEVEVLGEAENGVLALQKIVILRPDIVFLDIEMPVMGGFELLDELNGGWLPAVIMVTAYDEHAIRAFEAGAVDYLLKPASQRRLKQALDRARRLVRNPIEAADHVAQLQVIAPVPAGTSKIKKIVGKLGQEFFLLNPDEVLAFQADGEIVWIVTAKHRYVATQNLKSLEERLVNSSFRRIHRNALVNLEQIRKMSMITSQRWLLTLNNGQEFIVSKRQAKNVRDVLNW